MQHFIPHHRPLLLFQSFYLLLSFLTTKIERTSNELSSDVELNASFFQLLNWNRLKFNVTLLLFHRKNCKMKPVNNKSNVNPLSFWHRLPQKYFSLEFILHQFHQNVQKRDFFFPRKWNKIGGGNNSNNNKTMQQRQQYT